MFEALGALEDGSASRAPARRAKPDDAIVSVLNLAIWGGIGPVWWETVGLW